MGVIVCYFGYHTLRNLSRPGGAESMAMGFMVFVAVIVAAVVIWYACDAIMRKAGVERSVASERSFLFLLIIFAAAIIGYIFTFIILNP
jgi:hypothetical protein